MNFNDTLSTNVSLDQEKIVAWLSRPQSYAQQPHNVEKIETHISRVFLAGDRVFKLKKPVHFDFLDFSTLEKREQACHDEVRLNRRLAGDVYRGVRAITRTVKGDYEFDGAGTIVDWVIEMRRLPQNGMLDDRLQRGGVGQEELNRLTKFLCDFYATAPKLHPAPEDYVQAIVEHAEANRRVLLKSCTDAVQCHRVRRIHTAQLRLLRTEPEMFFDRVRRGRIVDGHGDLRPEHICLLDPPIVFDCLEFSADLRRIDALDELCFLTMECDRLHAADAGTVILERYKELCDDRPPATLIAFYKSYRAVVRAKVAALRAQQLQGEGRCAEFSLAEAYLTQADRYLSEAGGGPQLIVVCGLMGTGKTTLARGLSKRLGAELIRTDVVRDELIPKDGAEAAFGEGRYSPELRDRVYHEVLRRAAAQLDGGLCVILDGTYLKARDRFEAMECGRSRGAAVQIVECVCPPAVSKQRIDSRRQTGSADASEARVDLYDQQRQNWEPSDDSVSSFKADTTQLPEHEIDLLLRRLPRLAVSF